MSCLHLLDIRRMHISGNILFGKIQVKWIIENAGQVPVATHQEKESAVIIIYEIY